MQVGFEHRNLQLLTIDLSVIYCNLIFYHSFSFRYLHKGFIHQLYYLDLNVSSKNLIIISSTCLFETLIKFTTKCNQGQSLAFATKILLGSFLNLLIITLNYHNSMNYKFISWSSLFLIVMF